MIWWAVGLVAGYLLLAPLLVVAALWVMLRAGIIDWSGEKRSAPDDPLVIGYRGDPSAAFGWDFETVRYRTELGEAEAWVVPADGDPQLWAIWVHGIGGIRENGYRLVKTLHEAGVPVLMITYRNDKAAPSTADGMYSFGLTEWPDLEAAVDYAVSRGAERVVIAAESMGAAITGQYLKRAENTDRVVGLALDAPALDFLAIVYAAGKRYWCRCHGSWLGQACRFGGVCGRMCGGRGASMSSPHSRDRSSWHTADATRWCRSPSALASWRSAPTPSWWRTMPTVIRCPTTPTARVTRPSWPSGCSACAKASQPELSEWRG